VTARNATHGEQTDNFCLYLLDQINLKLQKVPEVSFLRIHNSADKVSYNMGVSKSRS